MYSLTAKVLKVSSEFVLVEFKDKSQFKVKNEDNLVIQESQFVSVIQPDGQLTICGALPSVGRECWMW